MQSWHSVRLNGTDGRPNDREIVYSHNDTDSHPSGTEAACCHILRHSRLLYKIYGTAAGG